MKFNHGYRQGTINSGGQQSEGEDASGSIANIIENSDFPENKAGSRHIPSWMYSGRRGMANQAHGEYRGKKIVR